MSPRSLIVLAIILGFFGVVSMADAATFYVRKDGNVACNGQYDAAYDAGSNPTNCAKLAIYTAYAVAAAGDVIKIGPGTYSEGADAVNYLNFGTASKSATFESTSGDRSDTIITAANTSYVVRIRTTATDAVLTFRNLTISGYGTSNSGVIKNESGLADVILDGVTVINQTTSSIGNAYYAQAAGGNETRDLTITNSSLYASSTAIFWNGGGNLTITGSNLYSTVTGGAALQLAATTSVTTIQNSALTTWGNAYSIYQSSGTSTALRIYDSTLTTDTNHGIYQLAYVGELSLGNNTISTVGTGYITGPNANTGTFTATSTDFSSGVSSNLSFFAPATSITVSGNNFLSGTGISVGNVVSSYHPIVSSLLISGNDFTTSRSLVVVANVASSTVSGNTTAYSTEASAAFTFGYDSGVVPFTLGTILFDGNTITYTGTTNAHCLMVGAGANSGTYTNNKIKCYSGDNTYGVVIKGDGNTFRNNLVYSERVFLAAQAQNNIIENNVSVSSLSTPTSGLVLKGNSLPLSSNYTGLTWNDAGTISKTGQFSGYEYVAGYNDHDKFVAVSGDGVVAGSYLITGKTSNDAITISGDLTSGSGTITNLVGYIMLPSFNNTVVNNIAVSNHENQAAGGESLYVNQSKLNTWDYNLYHNSEDGYLLAIDTSNYSTLADARAAWAALYPGLSYANNDQNSINSDPLLTDPPNGDFTISYLSPAIDVGSTTSRTTDYLGNPIYGLPDIGAYEYQPPYTMGTHLVATSAPVRIYGDEKFRVKSATTSPDTADLSVTITGSDKTDWLDLEITTWSNTGAYQKAWTASSTISDLATTFTVGDLVSGNPYTVSVDGVAGANITGANCTSGVCTADENGQITFAYAGTYSAHEFEVLGDATGPTRSAGSPSGSLAAGTTETTISLTTDEAATCKYGTTAGTVYASMATTFSTTGGTSHSTTVSSLTDGQTYTYYIRCTDGSANANESDYSISFSVSSPAGASGTTAARRAQALLANQANPTTPTISELTTRLNQLKAQLATLLAQSGPSAEEPNKFTKNLELGDNDPEVKLLQQFLNTHGYQVAPQGPGSPGQETTIFGYATRAALIKFQQANQITPAIGFFGPVTRGRVEGI